MSLPRPPGELEQMLDSPLHEVRVGALSVMAKQAARRSTPDAARQALFELYLRRHDRIDNWDLVDLAAHHVVGRHLEHRPRGVLYELARSGDVWRRRTPSTARCTSSGAATCAMPLRSPSCCSPTSTT